MISVIIPFYNEIESIFTLLTRIQVTLNADKLAPYEMLVVDNGSGDSQKAHLVSQLAAFPNLRILTLSRNFGYQGALWAGLDHAKGDTVIFIDGDGEDPPEVISEFLEKWREGYQVVYGVRLSRQVRWYYSIIYRVYYRMLAKYSNIYIPLDAGEFSLVSGKALVALKTFGDRTRMMRILRAWVGYRQVAVPYHREKRIGGESKFGFLRAFAFAWDGFISITDIPVRLSIYSTIACFVLGVLGCIYYVLWHFFGTERIPGHASLNITILFLFSVLFMCVGVLARYIMTLLDETRKRPPYLVDTDTGPELPGQISTKT